MRIIETEINDMPENNISNLKIKLADSIISYVQPIFSKDYNNKLREIKELKKSLNDKKEKIKREKDELEELLKLFTKKDKERQLLNKMGRLIQTGLIQESMKTEISIMLKSFNTLSEEKITSYLNETIRLLSQKFAKS
jgi:uncharacterized protein (DUF2344 family)